jgi:hypothetical protein
MESILTKHKRQPKIFVDVPSEFKFMDSSAVSGISFKELPVYSMTGANEIAMKTPEALLNGEAVKNLIQTCIPAIKDAGKLSSIDIEFLLIAIRIASYGNEYSKSSVCPHCNESNSHDLELGNFIDDYNRKEFTDTVTINGLKFYIRPLNYDEWTEIQTSLFQANRTMFQIAEQPEMSEEQKDEITKSVYTIIQSINQRNVLYQVYKVKDGEEEETDLNAIRAFILEEDRQYFNGIEQLIKQNTKTWDLPKLDLTCGGCEEKYTSIFTMDDSNFFGG